MAQVISRRGISEDIAPVTGAVFCDVIPGAEIELDAYTAEQVADGLLAGVLVSDGDTVSKRALGCDETWIDGYEGMYSRVGDRVYSWKWGKRKLLKPNSHGQVQLWKDGRRVAICPG